MVSWLLAGNCFIASFCALAIRPLQEVKVVLVVVVIVVIAVIVVVVFVVEDNIALVVVTPLLLLALVNSALAEGLLAVRSCPSYRWRYPRPGHISI